MYSIHIHCIPIYIYIYIVCIKKLNIFTPIDEIYIIIN